MRPCDYPMILLSATVGVLGLWLAWQERRSFQWWRKLRGGRWGLTVDVGARRAAWQEDWASFVWAPESEIREGVHVTLWEEWPRTRVRKGSDR